MSYTGEGGLRDIRERIPREYGEVVLDSNGDATITFVNPAPATPSRFLQLTPWIDPGDNPVIANPVDWITDGSGENYTGATIRGQRIRPLPATILTLGALNGFLAVTPNGVLGTAVDWMLY